MAAEGGRRTARSAPPHRLQVGKALLASERRLAGTRVGGYRVESLIARGGMSEVYKAVDPKLGRTVALKLLPPFMAESDWVRDRFLREARIASSLEHPNVVPIYDAGRRDGVLWIAMRYIDGPDLRTLIEREGPLTTRRTFSILKQIAGALDAAHEAGLVHRDVKPQNILIIPAKDHRSSDQAFLSDFGLAKALGSASRSTSRTFMGTVNYVSPEQIRGKSVDRRSDIYSLGCVLYECLTGAVPFERDSDVSVLWAHVEDHVRPASQLRPELPSAVDAVIRRALAKAPEDRFSACGEVISAYRSALRRRRSGNVWDAPAAPVEDEPATALTAPLTIAESVRRPRSLAGSLAVWVAALSIGASGVYALTRADAPAPVPPPAQAAGEEGASERTGSGSADRTTSGRDRDDADRTVRGRGSPQREQARLQGLIGAGEALDDTAALPPIRTSDGSSAPALTRTVTGEYTGVAADGLGPSDCVGDNAVGCVFFKARADERYLDVRVSDKLGGSVRVWVRQNYDSDPSYDGDWATVCNESEKPIPIVPGAEINVLIQRGECDGNASRPSAGTVTASFYSRRP